MAGTSTTSSRKSKAHKAPETDLAHEFVWPNMDYMDLSKAMGVSPEIIQIIRLLKILKEDFGVTILRNP